METGSLDIPPRTVQSEESFPNLTSMSKNALLTKLGNYL